MNVYYKKTVVGWWNIYPAGSDAQFVNLSLGGIFYALASGFPKSICWLRRNLYHWIEWCFFI